MLGSRSLAHLLSCGILKAGRPWGWCHVSQRSKLRVYDLRFSRQNWPMSSIALLSLSIEPSSLA